MPRCILFFPQFVFKGLFNSAWHRTGQNINDSILWKIGNFKINCNFLFVYRIFLGAARWARRLADVLMIVIKPIKIKIKILIVRFYMQVFELSPTKFIIVLSLTRSLKEICPRDRRSCNSPLSFLVKNHFGLSIIRQRKFMYFMKQRWRAPQIFPIEMKGIFLRSWPQTASVRLSVSASLSPNSVPETRVQTNMKE